jgi:hypothetical protein
MSEEPLNCRLRGGETGLSSLIPGGIDLKQSNSSTGIISEFRVNYERCIGLFQDLGFFRVCWVVFESAETQRKAQLCVRSVFGSVFLFVCALRLAMLGALRFIPRDSVPAVVSENHVSFIV